MIGNLWDFYAARARQIGARDHQPGHLPGADAWAAMRPGVHQQFMASLGLKHLPDRCDPRLTVTGTFEGPGYTAQKIAFQILPDVWSTAHLHRPASIDANRPAPAVLYTCGHQQSGAVGYQHHAIAWARRGYVCLILDTIEQHDNPGDHHGLHSGRRPEWISMGYTAAGGEVFNGIRALDLLLEQPGVDRTRVGVTGLSGGGSQSFRLAAADDRLRAVATIAGVSDPAFAIAMRTVEQHCDCMYEHNRFARDVSVWAALIAPRPLLYCSARHDNLYVPEEFRSVHRHAQARYEKLGCADRCALVEYDGPHGYGTDPKPTIDAIHQWFDKHVAGATHPPADPFAIRDSGEVHPEPAMSVFHGVTPQPNRLDLLPELLSPRGQVRLPESADQWQPIQSEARKRLKSEVFHLLDDVESAQTLKQTGNWTHEDVRWLEWHGDLGGMRQYVTELETEGGGDRAVIIGIGDRATAGRALARALHTATGGRGISAVGIEPRGAGRTVSHPSQESHLNREGCLTGLTPAMVMVQDLHHLMPHVHALPEVQGRAVYLYGQGQGAVAMLYHALLNPNPAVKGVILQDLPRSHVDGSHPILGILEVMDLPHAVGLLAPLQTMLVTPRGTGFDLYWPTRAHARLSQPTTFSIIPDLRAAILDLSVEPK